MCVNIYTHFRILYLILITLIGMISKTGTNFSKKTEDNKCWQVCGEIGTLYTVGEHIKWCSHYGKQYGSSSRNLKYW